MVSAKSERGKKCTDNLISQKIADTRERNWGEAGELVSTVKAPRWNSFKERKWEATLEQKNE